MMIFGSNPSTKEQKCTPIPDEYTRALQVPIDLVRTIAERDIVFVLVTPRTVAARVEAEGVCKVRQ